MAEAADESFRAHVGVNIDPDNHRAVIEPVYTDPDHRRMELALALMREGIRRAQDTGARVVYVETGAAVAANELYEAAGFTEAYKGTYWKKGRRSRF